VNTLRDGKVTRIQAIPYRHGSLREVLEQAKRSRRTAIQSARIGGSIVRR
jgi:hypothetical protein